MSSRSYTVKVTKVYELSVNAYSDEEAVDVAESLSDDPYISPNTYESEIVKRELTIEDIVGSLIYDSELDTEIGFLGSKTRTEWAELLEKYIERKDDDEQEEDN